jgi:hypothetical protein
MPGRVGFLFVEAACMSCLHACVPLHAEPSEKRAPGVTPALPIKTVWRYYTGVALSQLKLRSSPSSNCRVVVM